MKEHEQQRRVAERDEAVLTLIRNVIIHAKASGRKVGICGQAPSDHEGFAEMLVDCGINSISLNPDSVLKVRQRIAKYEEEKAGKASNDAKSHKEKDTMHKTKHHEKAEAQ